MNNNQVLAIWGSPDSGKTTLSVKITKGLEAIKRSVAIVTCDEETPMLPVLTPAGKQNHPSLGELLSQSRISQTDILKYSAPYGDEISLIGYRLEENETTYPIVAKLSKMRTVSEELDYEMYKEIKMYLSVLAIIGGIILAACALNNDWKGFLFCTTKGKISLSITALVIFVTLIRVIRLTKPVEFRRWILCICLYHCIQKPYDATNLPDRI